MQALLVGGHELSAAPRLILGRDRSPAGHVADYSFWRKEDLQGKILNDNEGGRGGLV